MWNRQQLKEKARHTFKRNYWKCILISLLFMLVTGGAMAGSAASAGSGNKMSVKHSDDYILQHFYEIDEQGNITPKNYDSEFFYSGDEDRVGDYAEDGWDHDESIHRGEAYVRSRPISVVTFLVVFLGVFSIIFLILLAFAIVIDIFICNPVEVGCSRFYFRNLEEQAQAKEALYAFDHNYRNIVRVLFFRDLYTVLWTLLFVIPGIVKSYEYQMIPYLLAEDPNMTKEQAFAGSKRMMSGNKWRAFVLDLSFLGWRILSIFTFGLLNIFYVQPYIDAAHAALYETLRYQMSGTDRTTV